MAEIKRVVIGKRLAYFRQAASAEYWDEVWSGQDSQQLYEQAARGELGYYEDIFPKYLPKEGRIIEAGSGLGQFVIALRARGYTVDGVDYGRKTVEALRQRFPDQPFRWGDVTQLDVPDGYYQGYISLGVMEHRQEGPEPFLSEANRMLGTGGVALISIPFLNGLRRLKMSLGFFGRTPPADLAFYQYAYSPVEFDEYLQRAGFSVIAHHQYGGYKGVKDELPFLTRFFKTPELGRRLQRFLMNWGWAEHHMGHMLMYVCQKSSAQRKKPLYL
ncbi:MAG: class I SAM-dependent methyltransferase [Anaerolineales bacterium]